MRNLILELGYEPFSEEDRLGADEIFEEYKPSGVDCVNEVSGETERTEKITQFRKIHGFAGDGEKVSITPETAKAWLSERFREFQELAKTLANTGFEGFCTPKVEWNLEDLTTACKDESGDFILLRDSGVMSLESFLRYRVLGENGNSEWYVGTLASYHG